jgi:hypothetical protein
MVNWPFFDRMQMILDTLSELGMNPDASALLDGYTTAGKYLYRSSAIDESSFDSWGWYAVSRAVPRHIGEMAVILYFDSSFLDESRYDSIVQAKRTVRDVVGSAQFNLSFADSVNTTYFRATHAPDYQNIQYETDVVSFFSQNGTL